ncbi:MAG TPA: hypothetical protein PLL66_09490, partial [Bacteroidales bacterium]|nr:hypothetical protein [Bacteroidales bacterium]
AVPAEETAEEEGSDEYDYMNDYFKWEFTIEFEANVKKYDVQNDTAVSISDNKKIFVESGNIFNIPEKESKWVFKTK